MLDRTARLWPRVRPHDASQNTDKIFDVLTPCKDAFMLTWSCAMFNVYPTTTHRRAITHHAPEFNSS